MTKSSWEQAKERSKYHFNNRIIHPEYDTVDVLGIIQPTWTEEELEKIIEESKAVTWRTRGNPAKEAKVRGEDEFKTEEYDLEQQGYGKDYEVTNLNWEVPQSLMDIANAFALEPANMMVRVHVQHPGQVWNLHMDKLEKWCPEDPSSVVRYMVALTEWQPGQFWSYGNYNHSSWREGEVTTFDWQNVPHSTANAGHHPRVTLQITGIRTKETTLFESKLRNLYSKRTYMVKRTFNR